MAKRRISLTIDSDILDEIDAKCSQTRRNRSEQVQALCSRALQLEPVSTTGASFTIRAPLPIVIEGFLTLGLKDPGALVVGSITPDPEGRKATGEQAEMCRELWRSLKKSQVGRIELDVDRVVECSSEED